MKIYILIGLLFSGLTALAQPPDYPGATTTRMLIRAEYFFDTDPGFGNGTPLTITPGSDINNLTSTIQLNGSALNNGFHRLYIRIQDDAGKWSLTNNALFDNVNVPLYPTSTTVSNITEVEYFIDTDPGLGAGHKLSIPVGTDISSVNALVNLSGVAPGVHRLFIRSKDMNGKWSLTHFALFDNTMQFPYPSAPAAAPALSEAEYYFDTDPGFGNGTPITLPSAVDVNNFSVSIPVESLAQGPHTLYLRSRQNPWSLTAYVEFVYGATLPVQWKFVKAEDRDGDGFISWATSAENNADKFVIEYSTDGKRFVNIGEVNASNNAQGSTYSFRHVKPGTGTAYYRIRQVDNDGKITYSKVMLLLFRAGIIKPVLFPNPATSVIYVAIPLGYAVQNAEVYDMSGRMVKAIRTATSDQVLSIPLQELKNGTYLIHLMGKNEKTTLLFNKQ